MISSGLPDRSPLRFIQVSFIHPSAELPTVLLFAGLSCIFSDCSALFCIFSLRPAFFSHLNGAEKGLNPAKSLIFVLQNL